MNSTITTPYTKAGHNAHENMRCYLFESVMRGNHAETIKDRQTGSVASYYFYLQWGLKLRMCQFAASRAAERGRIIVEELGLSPEKSRNA